MPTKKQGSCQNCESIQGCNKPHHGTCREFKPVNDPGLKPRKTRGMCIGCGNDYYNHGEGKAKAIGGSCMSFTGATVELRPDYHSLSQAPPWPTKWKLSCFHRRW